MHLERERSDYFRARTLSSLLESRRLIPSNKRLADAKATTSTAGVMAKVLCAVRALSRARVHPHLNMGIRPRVDNWTFCQVPALRRQSSIDVEARGSHSSVMLRLAAFHLKLPHEGTEVAGI